MSENKNGADMRFYLYTEHINWISKEAHKKRISKSALLRELIEKEKETAMGMGMKDDGR